MQAPQRDRLKLVQTRTVAETISIDAEFAELIETVWACERWERAHPFTVATIRALALRRGHSESALSRAVPNPSLEGGDQEPT